MSTLKTRLHITASNRLEAIRSAEAMYPDASVKVRRIEKVRGEPKYNVDVVVGGLPHDIMVQLYEMMIGVV